MRPAALVALALTLPAPAADRTSVAGLAAEKWHGRKSAGRPGGIP
jgi:hypothetical protein